MSRFPLYPAVGCFFVLWLSALQPLAEEAQSVPKLQLKAPVSAIRNVKFAADVNQPPKSATPFTAGGLQWQCRKTRCEASGSADAGAACQALVAQVGALKQFYVNGAAVAPALLQKCHAGSTAQREINPQIQTVIAPPKASTPRHLHVQTPPAAVPPPAAAASPATPEPRRYPMAVRSRPLTVTGTGAAIDRPPPFTTVNIRARSLTVTGTGAAIERPAEFSTRNIRAPALRVTGTGARE